MTVATKLETIIIEKICEQGLSKRNIRIAEAIIRRQARRQNKILGDKISNENFMEKFEQKKKESC